MMSKRRRLLSFMVLVLGIFTFCLGAQAKWGPNARHTDKNKDGQIDKKESHMEKRWEKKQWTKKAKTWWQKRADTNNDGIVDSEECSAWEKLTKELIDLDGNGIISPKEKRLCWRHTRSRVNTALERKYDANGDGWFEPEEVKALLKDRYTLIKTKGKAKVDSAVEEEYDTDNDGIIDAKEAEALTEDTQ